MGKGRRLRHDPNAVCGYFVSLPRLQRFSRSNDRTRLFMRFAIIDSFVGKVLKACSLPQENFRMTTMALAVLSTAACLMPTLLHAENLPCSGRKAGIAMCRGDLFVCNDGSISASKKSCSRFMGGTGGRPDGPAFNLTPPMAPSLAPSSEGSCSCRSGSFCVGPRGGRFCLTDSGTKSYLRR